MGVCRKRKRTTRGEKTTLRNLGHEVKASAIRRGKPFG